MPPKKNVERSKAPDNDRLLQYGPRNNIIAWRDRMEEECVELYGMTGTFFSANKAYHIPYISPTISPFTPSPICYPPLTKRPRLPAFRPVHPHSPVRPMKKVLA